MCRPTKGATSPSGLQATRSSHDATASSTLPPFSSIPTRRASGGRLHLFTGPIVPSYSGAASPAGSAPRADVLLSAGAHTTIILYIRNTAVRRQIEGEGRSRTAISGEAARRCDTHEESLRRGMAFRDSGYSGGQRGFSRATCTGSRSVYGRGSLSANTCRTFRREWLNRRAICRMLIPSR